MVSHFDKLDPKYQVEEGWETSKSNTSVRVKLGKRKFLRRDTSSNEFSTREVGIRLHPIVHVDFTDRLNEKGLR
jgi:hypothetical protein